MVLPERITRMPKTRMGTVPPRRMKRMPGQRKMGSWRTSILMAGIEPGCFAVCCNSVDLGITENPVGIEYNTFQVRTSRSRCELDVSNEIDAVRLKGLTRNSPRLLAYCIHRSIPSQAKHKSLGNISRLTHNSRHCNKTRPRNNGSLRLNL